MAVGEEELLLSQRTDGSQHPHRAAHSARLTPSPESNPLCPSSSLAHTRHIHTNARIHGCLNFFFFFFKWEDIK